MRSIWLLVIAIIIWLSIVGAIGYTAVHFILKFW